MAIFFDFLFLIKYRNIMHLRIKNLIKTFTKIPGCKPVFFHFVFQLIFYF